MDFDSLIGNNEVKNMLSTAVKNNHVLHSYMFIGTKGIGKKLFAKAFAKKILCLEKQEGTSCDCKSCVEFDSDNHPDYYEINPEDGIIKIDQIRKMQEKVLEKPIVSDRKVYIINDSDKMTVEAGNCLLKTLEEPPAFLIIILIAENESMILNTIRSRCTKIAFKPIDDDLINKYIKDKYEIPSVSENILQLINGSIGNAINYIDKREMYEEIEKAFSNIEKTNILDVINKLECLYSNKDNIYEVLDYINVLLIKKAKENYKYLNYINKVEETKKRLKANSNYDMCIDNLLFTIWEE